MSWVRYVAHAVELERAQWALSVDATPALDACGMDLKAIRRCRAPLLSPEVGSRGCHAAAEADTRRTGVSTKLVGQAGTGTATDRYRPGSTASDRLPSTASGSVV